MSSEHLSASELKSVPINTHLLYQKDDHLFDHNWYPAKIIKYKKEDNTLHIQVWDESMQIPLKLYYV